VRIAGAVRKLLQFAENGDISVSAQQLFQLSQGRDAILEQEPPQRIGGIEDGAHNDGVPPDGEIYRKNYIIINGTATDLQRRCTTRFR
jgi:hypothetical protein